jgi:hypothetical protein
MFSRSHISIALCGLMPGPACTSIPTPLLSLADDVQLIDVATLADGTATTSEYAGKRFVLVESTLMGCRDDSVSCCTEALNPPTELVFGQLGGEVWSDLRTSDPPSDFLDGSADADGTLRMSAFAGVVDAETEQSVGELLWIARGRIAGHLTLDIETCYRPVAGERCAPCSPLIQATYALAAQDR